MTIQKWKADKEALAAEEPESTLREWTVFVLMVILALLLLSLAAGAGYSWGQTNQKAFDLKTLSDQAVHIEIPDPSEPPGADTTVSL